MAIYDIYGLGAALVDTEIEVSDDDLARFGVKKGLMTLVDEARQSELLTLLADHLIAARRASGGSAANSMIAAQYLGAKTFYSCKVANDDNGAFFLNDLAGAGINYPTFCMTPDAITGKCLVMITPDAERTMNTYLGVSEKLSGKEIDTQAAKDSAMVYIEGYLVTSPTGRAAATELLALARDNGVRTALSLSDPGIVEYFHDELRTLIGPGVDLLFCNRAEATTFTGTDNLDAATEHLRELSRISAVTCGAEGAVIIDDRQSVPVAGRRVKAIDTNGAGDMFAGAFLAAMTRGMDPVEAAAFANRVAALVVAQYGPRLRPDQYETLLRTLDTAD